MAMLNFDATGVTPDAGFTPIPAGKYLAMIRESEVKATKAGTGHMLVLKWEVIEGQYKGRTVFDRVNISNHNKQSEEIGQRQLSAICHAAGRLQVADSAELHGIPCMIRVVITEDKSGKYDAGNEVKGYESAAGARPVAATVAAPANAAATPPWKRGATA